MNKRDVIISVVIPAYNVADYIENTLKSLIDQTFKQFEIILIDDGSTDKTLDIAKRILQNENVIYRILHQKNKGVSYARNKGINLSKGKFIYFIDSDDIIYENCLYELYKNAIIFNLDFSFCGTDIIYPSKVIPYTKKYFYLQKPMKGEKIIKYILEDKIWIMPGSFLVKKDIISRYKIKYNEKFKYGEDQIFILDILMRANKVYCIHKSGLKYIQRNNSATKMVGLEWKDYIDSYIYFLNNVREEKETSFLYYLLKRNKIPKCILLVTANLIRKGYSLKTIRNLILNNNYNYYLNRFKLLNIKSDIKTYFLIIIFKEFTILFYFYYRFFHKK